MNYCNPINYIGIEKFNPLPIKPKTIQTRRSRFICDLSKHLSEYGKDMLNEFYKYWSEPNKSNTKMRFELERTWDLGLRLQRWQRLSSKPSQPNNNQITN